MSRGFRICMAKGGKGVFKGELRPAKVDPRFDICRVINEPLRIKVTPPIFVRQREEHGLRYKDDMFYSEKFCSSG